jgi:hypothetical protein
MNKETILGLLRHAATFGGGVLTSNGLATSEEITTGVGALIALIGVVWSILQKRSAAQAATPTVGK